MDSEFYEVDYHLPGASWQHYCRVDKLSSVNGALARAKAVSQGPLPKLSPGEVRSALLRGVAQYYETQPWEPSLAETRLAEKVGIRFQRRYKDGGADRPDEVYWMAWYGSNPGVGVCVGCWDDVVKFAQSQGLSL